MRRDDVGGCPVVPGLTRDLMPWENPARAGMTGMRDGGHPHHVIPAKAGTSDQTRDDGRSGVNPRPVVSAW